MLGIEPAHAPCSEQRTICDLQQIKLLYESYLVHVRMSQGCHARIKISVVGVEHTPNLKAHLVGMTNKTRML